VREGLGLGDRALCDFVGVAVNGPWIDHDEVLGVLERELVGRNGMPPEGLRGGTTLEPVT